VVCETHGNSYGFFSSHLLWCTSLRTAVVRLGPITRTVPIQDPTQSRVSKRFRRRPGKAEGWMGVGWLFAWISFLHPSLRAYASLGALKWANLATPPYIARRIRARPRDSRSKVIYGEKVKVFPRLKHPLWPTLRLFRLLSQTLTVTLIVTREQR